MRGNRLTPHPASCPVRRTARGHLKPRPFLSLVSFDYPLDGSYRLRKGEEAPVNTRQDVSRGVALPAYGIRRDLAEVTVVDLVEPACLDDADANALGLGKSLGDG